MSRIKPYNYEKYSIFDIIKYLNQKGLKIKHHLEHKRPTMLHVINTKIYIDFPSIDKTNKLIFANIRFEDYPKTKNFNQDKKLFETLKKRFGAKKEERKNLSKIKDQEKIEKLFNNKNIWQNIITKIIN